LGWEIRVLSDTTRLAERAEKAGVDVTTRAVEDSVHVYPIFPFLPETKATMEEVARHRQQCHQATSEGQIAVAPLSLIAVQSRNLMVAHPVLAQPFNFRRRSTS
jgi:hypothetical protein